MENKEETESSREEGAVDADLMHCDSHLMMVIVKMMNRVKITKIMLHESHHNVNRTKFLSELKGIRVVLQRDDPYVQWQRYHCGQT